MRVQLKAVSAVNDEVGRKKPRTGVMAINQSSARTLQRDLTSALRAIRSAGLTATTIEIAQRLAEGYINIKLHTGPAPSASAEAGYMSVDEACAYGKFGRTQAYELIAAGRLRTKKLGSKTLVSKASIDRFMKRLPRKGN